MELQALTTSGNNGATHLSTEQAGIGDGGADAAENDVLLHAKAVDHNGEKMTIIHVSENQRKAPEITSVCAMMKRELNEIVFWKVRLWMVVIFMFLLIFAIIIIALVVCAAFQEDVDEDFDPSLFRVPLYFNGSFQLPNLVYTEELFILSSNESLALADACQEKLADLYRSSPALGRYFSEAEIYAFRNGSVIADYQLTFLMPDEQQDQLRNFTLSREMVYNVFRQFLYDQEEAESEPTYIDPVSLNMFLSHQ